MMVLIVFSDVDSTGQACGEPPGPRGADAPEQETGSTRARKGEWRRMRVWGTSAGAQAAPTLTEFGAFRMPSGWHVPPPPATPRWDPQVSSALKVPTSPVPLTALQLRDRGGGSSVCRSPGQTPTARPTRLPEMLQKTHRGAHSGWRRGSRCVPTPWAQDFLEVPL